MRTIRRLYFYAVSFVSLEVVLWGLISLARTALSPETIGGSVSRLAEALALILVGVPVFGFHWWMSQRFARQDMDEHASGVRAVFLYGALLATLIPILQNMLAWLSRALLEGFQLPASQALIGGYQIWSDNLIAIVVNGLVAAYFFTVLRADWKVIEPKDTFADIRRLYRYIWVVYGLVMSIASVQQLLRFMLDLCSGALGFPVFRINGINGLALALVGAPVWVYAWLTAQKSLAEQPERESLLRLCVLYLLSLAGVIVVLVSGGIVADVILRALFGEQMTFQDLIGQIAGPLSIAIPLGGVWAYYGGILARTLKEIPDAPRRAGLRRLYYYILSAIGLGAAFVGLSMLLQFVITFAIRLKGALILTDVIQRDLSAALATLVVSLPLWLLAWRPMQGEALAEGDAGDHARRSIIRKAYLYLAMFVSVIGGMVTAVSLVFNLLSALLGDVPSDFTHTILYLLELLFLFIMLGVYHGLTLRGDGRMAASALAEKHAAFPVLIFDPGDGFGQALLEAIQKQTPHLPAIIQPLSQPVTKEAAPKAVILPSDLALNPPKMLQKWLNGFSGSRLVVPRAAEDWLLTDGTYPLDNAARKAAQVVRQLAEEQEIHTKGGTLAWTVFVYIAAALFGLEILLFLISLGISLFMD